MHEHTTKSPVAIPDAAAPACDTAIEAVLATVATPTPLGPVKTQPRRPLGNPASRTARGRQHQPGWRPRGAPPAVVYMPSPNTVSQPDYIKMLATALTSMGMSRRKTGDFLDNAIARYTGTVRLAGSASAVKATTLFALLSDDESYRWLGEFMRYAEKPVTQAPHAQAIARIQIIAVALQIVRHPALRTP
jgi:hypothetical protein